MLAESVYYRNSHLYSTVQHLDGPSVSPDGRPSDCPEVPAVSPQNICHFHKATQTTADYFNRYSIKTIKLTPQKENGLTTV